ncbi:uncharacterized protein LOC110616482 [Manihot esculenta]|uniref:Uncharacterized protein n=2 Tax=Manihot esculenta TaxID=3983 RepID=A0A251L2R5_MANES|nr:uncharacterized protein LOC110616482 [Manihot esculenta]KAG8652064.1 hypothetical protein MANES_06G053300v8 [Manihot esculenta]OAY47114.1 hypothetical protein MANES_06G053300v8 [Manihot esculenta]OAY47115.1 hypothetical protein MANES_06G053300v8 [Manihot esculenta]
MPKDRRDRSVSFDRCKASPYTCSSSCSRQSSPKIHSETEENLKEWEEARCPVCMEHPHNAVLLICASHEKGCRPYMCDTSYRHSNCLDQFCKSFTEASLTAPQPEESGITTANLASVGSSEPMVNVEQSEEEPLSARTIPYEKEKQPILVCPLCRGQIKEWIAMEPARRFMNAKSRSCACESCDFSGTYSDLRKHARLEHPLVRPSQADPLRQRNWRMLERQRDLGDLISTLHSSFGEERDDDNIMPIDDGGWLTVFFLIRVFRPGSSTRSSSWSGSSRARGQLNFRRRSTRLWGETHDVETGSSSRDEENDSSDGGSALWRHSERIQRQTTPDHL